MEDLVVKEESKNEITEELIFSNNKEFPEDIKQKLREFLHGKTDKIEPTKMSSQLKGMLDKNFGSGWCVIVGGHFSGAFTYVGTFYIEINIQNMVIVIFKTYKPDKK